MGRAISGRCVLLLVCVFATAFAAPHRTAFSLRDDTDTSEDDVEVYVTWQGRVLGDLLVDSDEHMSGDDGVQNTMGGVHNTMGGTSSAMGDFWDEVLL